MQQNAILQQNALGTPTECIAKQKKMTEKNWGYGPRISIELHL